MATSRDEEKLSEFFREVTGSPPSLITPIESHASERRIFRLSSQNASLVGVLNSNRAENDAFVHLARYFKSVGLPVPEIHLYDAGLGLYIEEDLGEMTLLDLLQNSRGSSMGPLPQDVRDLYRRSLDLLVEFQIVHREGIPFSGCSNGELFAPHALDADIRRFSEQFLARILPSFSQDAVQADFASLRRAVSEVPHEFFLHGDFQARNIMVRGDAPFFIDFQGGCRGPLQYDVASLLYQSSARISASDRAELLGHYIERASGAYPIDASVFRSLMPLFVITRMLQVLGIYGSEGLAAGKSYFVQSIPLALGTLMEQLQAEELTVSLPNLAACIEAAAQSQPPAQQGPSR